jgi:branched-chain amino acid transport system substrate-binding protein
MKSKGIWKAISVLSVMGFVICNLGWATAQEADPIKIGYLADLSGPYAPVGQAQLNGTKLAIKEINKSGGVLKRPVELIVKDTHFMLGADPTPTYCKQFVNKDKVLYVSGGYADLVAETAKTHTVYSGTPFLSIVSANPVSNRGDRVHPYKLTGWFNMDLRSFCVYPYLLVNKLVPKKFVTIGPDYVWGWGCSAAAKNAVEQYGGEVIKEILTPLPTLKFDAYIAQIQELAPKGCTIVLSNSTLEAVAFLKAAYDAKLQDKGFRIVWTVADSAVFHGAIKPEQLAGVWGFPEWYYGIKGDPVRTKFVTKYYNEYSKLPTGNAAFYYLVNYFALTTINKVGTLEPDVWIKALKDVNIENITDSAEKSFSSVNGDFVRSANLYRFKKPEDMTVDIFPELPDIGPEWDHLELVHNFPLEYVKKIIPEELVTAVPATKVGDPRIGVGVRPYWEQYCKEHGLEMPSKN